MWCGSGVGGMGIGYVAWEWGMWYGNGACGCNAVMSHLQCTPGSGVGPIIPEENPENMGPPTPITLGTGIPRSDGFVVLDQQQNE